METEVLLEIICGGHVNWLRKALDSGVDPNMQLKPKASMLYIAMVYTSNVDISIRIEQVELLLQRGAKPTVHELYTAVIHKLHPFMSLLIKYGADANGFWRGSSHIFSAMACPNMTSVCILAEAGAQLPRVFPVVTTREIAHYVRFVIPDRIRRCIHAVMTLILVHKKDGRQSPFGQIDKHNVQAIAKLLWQSRRSPDWD